MTTEDASTQAKSVYCDRHHKKATLRDVKLEYNSRDQLEERIYYDCPVGICEFYMVNGIYE